MEKIPFALHLLELCRGHQEQPETKTSLSPSPPSTAGHPHYHQQHDHHHHHQQQAIMTILATLNDDTKILTEIDTETFFRYQIFRNRNQDFYFETKFSETI